MRKASLLLAFFLGLGAVAIVYSLTVGINGYDQKYDGFELSYQCFFDRNKPITKTLEVNDRMVVFKQQKITISETCNSHYSHPFNSVDKLKIFIKTWQFYANWLVYSLVFVGLVYSWNKHAHTRN